MWRIWLAPNNASKWQVGFNSAFKGLNFLKNCSQQTGFVVHEALVLRPLCVSEKVDII